MLSSCPFNKEYKVYIYPFYKDDYAYFCPFYKDEILNGIKKKGLRAPF